MFLNNLPFLMEHLPAHFRRADREQGDFLRRFLSVFCAELDGYDQLFLKFSENIDPETAPEYFIDFWLWNLFGWAWFPPFFTLARKREFFRSIATHYARRGTARGIREFLAAFGIRAHVITRPQYWGEWTVGESLWTMDGPGIIVVQIYPASAGLFEELSYWGEFTAGEGFVADPSLVPGRADIDELLRIQQPIGHRIIIEEIVSGSA